MATILAPTSVGSRRAVRRETTTIVRKAAGTVQAAGWPSSASAQPGPGWATIVIRMAADASPPPTAMPAPAPAAVRPRHQIPRTRSGQELEAAKADVQATRE